MQFQMVCSLQSRGQSHVWAFGMVELSQKAGPPFCLPSQGPGPGEPLFHATPTLGHPGPPGSAGDGNFTAPLLLFCCPADPHRASQTLHEKARPFQRNGFLHLYNVRAAVEKRGHWIYGNYIKFMESWQARSRKGLQAGVGILR